MKPKLPTGKTQLQVRTARMEAFSDGVFAIAITLLVLDLAIPGSGNNLGHGLLEQWPEYLAYLVSFAAIGGAWINHNLITDHLEYTDPIFLRLNLLLLLFVAVIPFPTHLLLANFLGSMNSERIAVTVYGANLLAVSLLMSTLFHYAIRAKMIKKSAQDKEMGILTKKIDPTLLLYLVVIGIGLAFPHLAVFLYLLISIYIMIPFQSALQRSRRS